MIQVPSLNKSRLKNSFLKCGIAAKTEAIPGKENLKSYDEIWVLSVKRKPGKFYGCSFFFKKSRTPSAMRVNSFRASCKYSLPLSVMW